MWWCSTCNTRLDVAEVTWDERHDECCGGCGEDVDWVEDESTVYGNDCPTGKCEMRKGRIQVSKFDFRPLSEQEKKMNDPVVKQAIRTLKVKGITIEQIEEAFRYYERLKGANANE